MVKPASISPLVERIPGARGLVGEHQRHDAVRLQHAAALGEDGGHALLVVAVGERLGALLAPELGGVGDRLVLLVRQLRGGTAPGRRSPAVRLSQT